MYEASWRNVTSLVVVVCEQVTSIWAQNLVLFTTTRLRDVCLNSVRTCVLKTGQRLHCVREKRLSSHLASHPRHRARDTSVETGGSMTVRFCNQHIAQHTEQPADLKTRKMFAL
jgi:hypothetical protein